MSARLAAVATIAALAFSPLACAPTPERPPGPPAAGPTIEFVVRATAKQGQRIERMFAYTLTAFQADGRPGDIQDPQTGQRRPSPYVGVAHAPVRIRLELDPGIIGASILVRGNARKGETISCHIEHDGLPVDDPLARSSVTQRIISGPVSVACVYVGR